MRRSYYAIIPANIRYDKELTPNAKLLYGEITALCNQEGYCWANNKYFSELYEVSTRTITNWIGQLSDKNYIRVELSYKENSKEVQQRKIYILDAKEEEDLSFKLTKENKDKIINTWNELGLQTLVSINNRTKRHSMLVARIKEYSFDEVIQAISLISKSSFLRGQNQRNWTITFDWLVRPNNFIKVLEGNYTDKGDNHKQEKGSEYDGIGFSYEDLQDL